MMGKTIQLVFSFFFFFIVIITIISWRGMVMAQNTTTVQVKVGVVLDMNTWVGKMGLKCISMALSDIYSSHPHFKTRLDLHVRDSKNNVIGAAAAALDLLKTKKVQAIIGPLTSMQANFLIHLGEEAHVPILSFSATSPSLSSLRSPYFFRAALNDSSQVQPITSIIQAFGWKEVLPIYIENEYGEGLIPFLTNAFQEIEIRVPYKSTIHPSANDKGIVAELYKLMTMQTRVFIVHMTRSLSDRLFTKANEIGMMSEGYVWNITDGITNSLNFFDHSVVIDSMQGVIGVKPHVPRSKKHEDFISKWKNKLMNSDLNVLGLWAYDAAISLAMAVEKVGALNLSILNLPRNSAHFDNVRVSETGIYLCQALSSIRFRGLSGNFSFVNGQLRSSAFEIVNVIGNGPRVIGFWMPEHGIVREFKFEVVNTTYNYSTSKANLKAIILPGDTTHAPKGWVVPTNGKVLRVGVPVKNGYSDFVMVTKDAITNTTKVTGYCIDVFDATMAALPYAVRYDYIPFERVPGGKAGSYYDNMVYQVFLGVFPKGSYLARDVSAAIVNVIEEDKMSEIEKTWFGPNNSCPDSSSMVSSTSLSVGSFWGLFLIVGVASSFALIIFMAMLAYEHRGFLVHLDLKALWRKYILKHEESVTDTHQDQTSPSSSALSIAPSSPTQCFPTQSIVSDDTNETFIHFEGQETPMAVANSHNPNSVRQTPL